MAGLIVAVGWRWRQARQNGPLSWPIARSFATEERQVWLTIDDGPGRAETVGMIEVLAEAGMQATFFFIGREVEQRRELVRRVRESGQSVGLHSYAHRSGSFWIEPAGWVETDLQRAEHALRVAGGLQATDPVWYRAPAGRWSAAQMRVCRRRGWHPVGWSASAGDGMCCGDVWTESQRLLDGLQPGAILLLHQGGRGQAGRASRRRAERNAGVGRVAALRYLVHRLQQEGWQTTVPKVESLRSIFPPTGSA